MSSRFALVLCYLLPLVLSDVIFNTTRISSPRDGLSLIEAGSNLYFVGGWEFHDNVATDKIEVFDLINRNWTTPLYLPSKRGFVTPVALESFLYFVGGYSYANPPFVFDPNKQDFISDHGQGPTVLTPIDISLHESTLTVIGTYSVDFLDLTTKTWNYSTELTKIKMELFYTITFTFEDIVVVIGGTNGTTNEPVFSAWIYNRTTNQIEEFPNALTQSGIYSDFKFTVTNQIISVWAPNGIILLHRLGTKEWYEIEMDTSYVSTIASSKTVTFIFDNTGYYVFNWTNPSVNLTQVIVSGFQYPFAVDGYVAFVYSLTSKEIHYYNDETALWDQIIIPIVLTDTFNIKLATFAGEWACISATDKILAVNIRQQYLTLSSIFTSITRLLPGNNSCHFFDTFLLTRYHFDFQEGNATLITDEQFSPGITPVAIVGDDFFTADGGVAHYNLTDNSFTQLINFTSSPLWAANDRHFVLMESLFSDRTQLRQYYNKVDIYDLEGQTWLNSTEMPFADVTHDWYLPATALGDKLIVWHVQSMAVFEPQTGVWTLDDNGTLSNPNDLQLVNMHVPVLTINGTAFMRTVTPSFTKYRAESPFEWSETVAAPSTNGRFFGQYFAIGNNQIFVPCRNPARQNIYFGTIYLYDVEQDSFDLSLPPKLEKYLTIVPVGDFMVGFAPSWQQLFYYQISTRQWYEQDYNGTVLPSAVYRTSYGFSVVVGGHDYQQNGVFSDTMLMFEDNSITIPPASPASANNTVSTPAGPTDSELIAAIVVPVGAALIAGALLLILLLRRKKKQQRHGQSISMTGLASKYGQWFIPFDQIKFGDQIGRGASGQVFKGSWKGSPVALKVSMTQANSTVISELEMMIQMRPHPNVVQLFGFSVHPETNSMILVIEFCDGGSLDDFLFEAKQSIPLNQKLPLLLGIAKGLNHLHSNNIVHRDVASRNVLLHKNEPKLTDFGMSRLIDEDTQRGTTKSELGPIRWMSPESLRNKEYSTKSDVWSFGVLMYEVIAQQEPHLNADPIEIGRLIRDNGLTPVIPESCPNKLADIMRSCWNIDAAGRPTIEEIIEQLEVQ